MPNCFEKNTTETARRESSLTVRAAWILFAKVIAFGFTFLLPLFLVRKLSQQDFGLYKQVFLIVSTSVTMLPLGFGMSAYYFLPRDRERQPQIVLNILCFYCAVAAAAAILIFTRPDILEVVFNGSELVGHAGPIAVIILLWVVSSFLDIVAVAHQEARLASLFIVTSQASKAILLLAAGIWFGSVQSLVYAAVIQGALQTVILILYLRSRFGAFWRSFDLRTLRMQLSYALPLGFAGLLFSMQMDLHQYFVSNRFGPSVYAIYAVGCFQLPLIGMLSESVCSVMIPRVSILQKNNQGHEIISLTARVMRKLAFVYFPIYAFLIVAGREFIAVLFTSQYLDSWPVFAVNITMIPLGILALDPILRAYAEQRYFVLKLRIVLVSALLAILWFGTSRLGPTGTISIVVCVAIVERLATTIRMASIVGVSRRDFALLRDVGKLAFAATAAAILTGLIRASLAHAAPMTILLACGAVFSAVYLAGVLLLGILKTGERNTIRKWLDYPRWWPGKRDVSPVAEGDY